MGGSRDDVAAVKERAAVGWRAPVKVAGIPYRVLVSQRRTLVRVSADLCRSPAGRTLLALWLDHHEELRSLVKERRVTAAWQSGGGPALLRNLIRITTDPSIAMPHTIDGLPPAHGVDLIHAALHDAASPPLRRALDAARAVLPDPAGLAYEQLIAALATA